MIIKDKKIIQLNLSFQVFLIDSKVHLHFLVEYHFNVTLILVLAKADKTRLRRIKFLTVPGDSNLLKDPSKSRKMNPSIYMFRR